MKSLLVTGGLGFVGQHLLEKLTVQDYEKVFCFCRNDLRGRDLMPRESQVEFLKCSLPFDTGACEQKIAGTDAVVHLAAVTGKAYRDEYFRVNVEGTRALIDMCRRLGISKFLYVSSIAVGFADKKNYYYAQSKEKAEEIVRTSGLRYTIVRPTIVLGRDSQLWRGMSRLALFPVIPIFGNGQAQIQPIWVDDFADILVDLLASDRFQKETLEVGGPESISIEEFLIRTARRLRHSRPRTIHLPLKLIQTITSCLEPWFLSSLPVTAGQLASFRFDGKPRTNALAGTNRAQMRTIDQMLSALCGFK